MVLRPVERKMLIEKIHEEIRHFGAMWTHIEVRKRFFWHDKTKVVKKFIEACEKCQLARQSGNMRSGDEKYSHMQFVLSCCTRHY